MPARVERHHEILLQEIADERLEVDDVLAKIRILLTGHEGDERKVDARDHRTSGFVAVVDDVAAPVPRRRYPGIELVARFGDTRREITEVRIFDADVVL